MFDTNAPLPVGLALVVPVAGLITGGLLAVLVLARRVFRNDSPGLRRNELAVAFALPRPVPAPTTTLPASPLAAKIATPPPPMSFLPATPKPQRHSRVGRVVGAMSSIFRRRDRRKALRREGNPVIVEWTDAQAQAVPALAEVVDRSKHGIALKVDRPIDVGAVLSVRSTLYPDCAEWVQVKVCNVRRDGEPWFLGCEFAKEVPWNLVLHFG